MGYESRARKRFQRTNDLAIGCECGCGRSFVNEVRFLHCRKCMRALPEGQSPEEWARLSVCIRPEGTMEVTCVRHGLRVVKVPLPMVPEPPDVETAKVAQKNADH